ncbi:tyrosine-type recombinase/integrase [Eisenbergiella massiliensis]|uniref:tyrosine-type recombinase/integrase n=1 Tax=Eisenbergiella massiliensis TaxID=1720294 RepID=UPI0023EFF348|nr:tyrosine-type recombinase/integrase [Eisenbergiella massiliensis]
MPTAKKLPSGSWRCQVYDYTDAEGKRHYESFTAESKKDSEFLAAQFSMEKEQRRHMSSSSLHNAIDVYIETSDAILSPTTIQGYRKIQKNAFSDIMELPLKKLTRQSLQDAVNLEAKRPNAKRKDKAPISAKTVHNEYGLITAVLNKYIPSLDCTVRLPQTETHIKDLPLPDEIYAAVKGSEVELAVMLAMWLSFSMSEVRGLTKSKSIRGNYLVVEEVVVDVDNQSIVKRKGKTKTRTRMHRMPVYIQELISRTDPQEDRLVPMTRSQVYFRFVKLIEKAGLKPMTYHDLRHVNASVMALLQVPDKYAQERGGWKTDAVMKKVYTHTFGQERQRVDNMIDEYFEEQIGITEPDIPEGYMAWLRNIGRQDTLELREKYAAFMAEISETCNTKCNTQ